jgi:hypothetical protein
MFTDHNKALPDKSKTSANASGNHPHAPHKQLPPTSVNGGDWTVTGNTSAAY